MTNERLDIDGNMWCIKEPGDIADPRVRSSWGATIAEAVLAYKGYLMPSVIGNLSPDLKPEKRDGFVGIPCAGTNVAFIGYMHSTGNMRVEFRDGGRYDYSDVPQEVWQKILISDSKGSELNRIVKGNFRYCRVN